MKKLSDLGEENIYFENAKKSLEQKLKVAVAFLDRNEFINAEIERINSEYINPPMNVQMKDGERSLEVLFFDFGEYCQRAFDLLIHGNDATLSDIIYQAKKDYIKAFKNSPESVQHANNSKDFKDTIIAMLSRGVGYLLYRKYLQEIINLPLKQPGNKNIIPIKTIDPVELITISNLLNEYENNIPDKVKEWKAGKDKTGCAVFCNYLFQKKLFEPNTIVTAKKFALNRYGININVMIEKLRKSKLKAEMEEKTTEMKRLILSKPYGKI
jgi:hypothetical protein